MKKTLQTGYKTRRVFSTVAFALGIAILLVFVIFAIFGEKIAPYKPNESFDSFLPCSKEHLLGTNNIGFDIWSQLIVATRPTLVVGVTSAFACVVIGVVIGVIAGYAGKVAGEAVNGFINFFLLIPMLPMAIVIAAYTSGNSASIILTISALCWCSTARAVRAKTLSVKNSDFVRSLKTLGYSPCRILFRHVLPNVLDVAAAKFIPSVASCIMVEATLSFLGMGSFDSVTWGVMINYAYTYGGISLAKYNWLLAPGVCIMLIQIGFYMIQQYIEFRRRIVQNATINRD